MSEQFAHCIQVCSEVEHHRRESMPAAVECYPLPYSRRQAPVPERVISAGRRVYPVEHIVIGLSPRSHKLDRLWSEVKVFKAVGLLLVEYYPRELSLLVYIAPFQPLDVAPTQAAWLWMQNGF